MEKIVSLKYSSLVLWEYRMKLDSTQLQHLAKLSKLHLTPDEEKTFLGNMDEILDFLSRLPAEEASESDISSEAGVRLFEEQVEYPEPESLFHNVKHEMVNDAISIRTSLSE